MSERSSRKPSVAASRKFSFVDVFGASNDIPTDNNTKPSRLKGKSNNPKVVWNGRDVTPKPIDPEHQDSSVCCSFEDVGFLKAGTDDGTRLPDAAKGAIPWLESLTNGASQTEKELTTENRRSSKIGDESGEDFIISARQELHPNYTNRCQGIFEVTLTETSTFELLNIPGSYVAHDVSEKDKNDENDSVDDKPKSQRQEKSTKVLRERAAQTFHNTVKNKACMAVTSDKVDKGCDPTNSGSGKINTLYGDTSFNDSKRNIFEAFGHHDFVESFTAAVIGCKGCLLDTSEGRSPSSHIKSNADFEAGTLDEILIKWSKDSIFRSPELLDSLQLVERAIHQVHNFKKQLRYRAIPIGSEAEIMPSKKMLTECADDPTGDMPLERNIGLEELFTFRCHDGRPVLAMCWHKLNHEVLAVGYGASQSLYSNKKDDGVIMLWSLRNESYPEKIINTNAVVKALDFSKTRPSILAVGMSDGNVALYDTECVMDKATSSLICDSAFLAGRHFSPVYQVKWICSGQESERLLSISGDGRILEWATEKGMSLTQLMVLEREVGTNNSISRKACGLSFDFPIENSTGYFAGAEDGSLYRCSCSYDDHHLGMYKGHRGPVKRIRFSPFDADTFLTCSDDWTVRLWSIANQEECDQTLELRSVDLTAAVNDIAWSNSSPTMFCLVAADGRLEIWDIENSTLDPIIVQHNNTVKPGTQRTVVLFGTNNPVVLTGNNQGMVEVFSIRDLITKDTVV